MIWTSGRIDTLDIDRKLSVAEVWGRRHGRQLNTLGIFGRPTRGKRRVMRVRDRTAVAHLLLVSELTAEESIRLQDCRHHESAP